MWIMKKTVIIQIGNSDNKLTQGEWASFVAEVDMVANDHVLHTHFKGGSDWDAPWQNACWVCEMNGDKIEALKEGIGVCRRNYKQDSVAMTFGETEFV